MAPLHASHLSSSKLWSRWFWASWPDGILSTYAAFSMWPLAHVSKQSSTPSACVSIGQQGMSDLAKAIGIPADGRQEDHCCTYSVYEQSMVVRPLLSGCAEGGAAEEAGAAAAQAQQPAGAWPQDCHLHHGLTPLDDWHSCQPPAQSSLPGEG